MKHGGAPLPWAALFTLVWAVHVFATGDRKGWGAHAHADSCMYFDHYYTYKHMCVNVAIGTMFASVAPTIIVSSHAVRSSSDSPCPGDADAAIRRGGVLVIREGIRGR